MKKLLEKNPQGFALTWIGIYVVGQNLAMMLNKPLGIPRLGEALMTLLESLFLLWWLQKNGLMKAFGLNRPKTSGKQMLYYLPLILLCTSNLWLGITCNLSPAGLAIHILLMLCVGFLEELIFRGFLFEALAKDNLKTAVVVSSLTFGIGHIVNLFNGSGMAFTDNLLQIVFAVAVGFLFVMVYLKSGSLIPCILAHEAINISSAFANRPAMTGKARMVIGITELVIIGVYSVYLLKKVPGGQGRNN